MRAVSHYSASNSSCCGNLELSFGSNFARRRGALPSHHAQRLCSAQALAAKRSGGSRRPTPTYDDATGNYIAKSTYGQTVVCGLNFRSSRAETSVSVEQELFGLTAADLRKVTAKIKQARTWRELREYVCNKTCLQAMDAICLSAAFAAMARVSSGKNARLSELAQKEVSCAFAVLLQQLQPQLTNMDAQGLASVAVSLAKMEYTEASMYKEIMEHSKVLMPEFSPQALANLIWALATANHQPCGAWLTEYYRRVEDQVETLNSQDIANIMYGLAKFDLMPDVWLMDGLVRRSLEAVSERDSVSGQDPATLIQCLARFYYKYNFRVSDDWLREYLSMVQPSLSAYMPFDLVSILHSLVVMNHMPGRAFMSDYYAVLKDRLMSDPALSYSDFQRLMWALSRVDFAPTQSWQRDFVTLSTPKLRHLKYRALSELIWALACWNCKPTQEWLDVFLAVTRPKLGDFKPHHLANTLSALARLGCRADSAWMDAALRSFQAQVDDVKAHDLVTVIDTMTVVSQGDWLVSQSRAINELAEIATSKFSFYDLGMHTKLACALATANIRPGVEWLRKHKKAVASCWGEDNAQEAAQELKQVYKSWGSDLEMPSR